MIGLDVGILFASSPDLNSLDFDKFKEHQTVLTESLDR